MKILIVLILLSGLWACNSQTGKPAAAADDETTSVMGIIKSFDPALNTILSPDALTEIIADSLIWSEGPLWVEKQQMLLFSDVPANIVYKWTKQKGKQLYLKPSGFTGTDTSSFREPGSNGLLLDSTGRLILCQHGNRQIARMEAPLDSPAAKFTSLAGTFNGKKFTSPNDCVLSSSGELFFTDPPYGLQKMDDDPLKEMPWNGVYKVKKDGTVILLTDSVSKPNGIALFPGEKKLLVANSDPAKPYWYIWDISGDSLINGKIFYTAASQVEKGLPGLPDGLKIDKNGNVIASGPGGIYFFNSNGKNLGMIRLDEPASNCALSSDEKTLFITNKNYVLRVKMRK